MNELYETLKSIMTEVTSPRAHIQKISISLDSKGTLVIQADWSDHFHTKLQLKEADAKEINAEFFLKNKLRSQRRDNEGANQ